jgi:hypothetical protein
MTLEEYKEWAKSVDWTPPPDYLWGTATLTPPIRQAIQPEQQALKE